ENAVVWLDWTPVAGDGFAAARLMKWLRGVRRLDHGADGFDLPTPPELLGDEADPDDPAKKAWGLEALGEIDDIAIVALPTAGASEEGEVRRRPTETLTVRDEKSRPRRAGVEGPRGSSLTEIRISRGNFDPKYAPLSPPWIETLAPLSPPVPGVPPRK